MLAGMSGIQGGFDCRWWGRLGPVKIVVKVWKCWQVTRRCSRLGPEHTSMKGRVSAEILQLGCGFLEHSFARVVLRDAVALVRDRSNVLCADEWCLQFSAWVRVLLP